MQRMKVLLVEDHDGFKEALRAFLESERDVEIVAEASDAIEAAELSLRYRPDLVVIDFDTPYSNGFEFVEKLKRMYPSMRVAVLSLKGGAAYQSMAMRHNVDAFIEKECAKTPLRSFLRAASELRNIVPEMMATAAA